ncbi:hypothetical protein VB796_12595 [Arcicella sp. LKC2W]|uniref:hypothetical protein n=1 Tax=Arcicella sp. LKC2W TaxID=2984198 RepID=UPI002B20BAD6|nr:hypothetical protein [Arcicella sp. LKC2W]MEA5459886.1 hypothetical protein [Arcicella sp. LKC2W]
MWKKEIHKFLEINQIAFEVNQTLSVFEILYLPDFQLYLHLIDLNEFSSNSISITYFQDLSEKVNIQNQRIIHLWEDVWADKKDLVQSRILAMIGKFSRLNARHCFIERIDKPTADKFLNENHLQASVKAKFKYGLFLKTQYVKKFLDKQSVENELIAVATFSGGRTLKEGERKDFRSYELIRFASLKGFVVVGGMDKLLKAFIAEHSPDDIMSYADRDWSDGRSYLKLGFLKIGLLNPQCFVVDENTNQRLLTHEVNVEIVNAGSIKYVKILKI